MSAGDNYTFQKSLNPPKDRTPFEKKHIIYANDINSGSYTNQLQFDLQSFSNIQNGYINLAEATLQIPVVVTASTKTTETMPAGLSLDNFIGWKNGSWNIINSISVQVDGKTEVIQPNNYTNAWINYRVMSSFSADDLKNFGPSILFSPDSTNTWQYNDNGIAQNNLNRNGNGITNNRPFDKYQTTTATQNNNVSFKFGNKGLKERMEMINARPDDVATGTTSGTVQNLGSLRGLTHFKNELKNFTEITNTGVAGGFYQQWFILCTIPLKYVSDFFSNMPLTKGVYLKMNITLNTGYCVVKTPDYAAANNELGMYSNASDINFQYTCPIMVCERDPTVLGRPTEYLVSVGVVKAPTTSVTGYQTHSAYNKSHPLGNCRITVPIVELKSNVAAEYVMATEKGSHVEWLDIYQTLVPKVEKNQTFNNMVSNGTSDAVGVLIIPMISSSLNGKISEKFPASLCNTSFSPAISPFATEPATPSPCSITELQVLHGGTNVLSPFISYTYEEFLYQLNGFLSINGNQTTGLTSGLFSQKDFEDGLRYYFISLFRDKEEIKMPKSINIIGKNNTEVTCDYLVYIISQKSMRINPTTGKVVQ